MVVDTSKYIGVGARESNDLVGHTAEMLKKIGYNPSRARDTSGNNITQLTEELAKEWMRLHDNERMNGDNNAHVREAVQDTLDLLSLYGHKTGPAYHFFEQTRYEDLQTQEALRPTKEVAINPQARQKPTQTSPNYIEPSPTNIASELDRSMGSPDAGIFLMGAALLLEPLYQLGRGLSNLGIGIRNTLRRKRA